MSTPYATGPAPVAWNAPDADVEIATRLNENDVLMGRGSPSTEYSGNLRFRQLVRERRDEYMAASGGRREKHKIATEILAAVHDRGGRFLVPITTLEEAERLRVPPRTQAWRVLPRTSGALFAKVKQLIRDVGLQAKQKGKGQRGGCARRASREDEAMVQQPSPPREDSGETKRSAVVKPAEAAAVAPEQPPPRHDAVDTKPSSVVQPGAGAVSKQKLGSTTTKLPPPAAVGAAPGTGRDVAAASVGSMAHETTPWSVLNQLELARQFQQASVLQQQQQQQQQLTISSLLPPLRQSVPALVLFPTQPSLRIVQPQAIVPRQSPLQQLQQPQDLAIASQQRQQALVEQQQLLIASQQHQAQQQQQQQEQYLAALLSLAQSGQPMSDADRNLLAFLLNANIRR